MAESMNEVTFVAQLGAVTAVRAAAAKAAGSPVLIAQGNVEEAQRDSTGSVKRCDMRLSSAGGRKLVSGEMKRPEVPEGRDPRNVDLVADARNKAVSRGLPLYFACNMAEIVLYEVSLHTGVPDRELGQFQLAPITRSGQVAAFSEEIAQGWDRFLDEVERHLQVIGKARPAPTSMDVLKLRAAISSVSRRSASASRTALGGRPGRA